MSLQNTITLEQANTNIGADLNRSTWISLPMEINTMRRATWCSDSRFPQATPNGHQA